jgi:hypothetical protein
VSQSGEQRVQFSEGEVVTPKLRSTARRSLFWIGVAAILVILALVSLSTIGVTTSSARLSATNPGPAGAEALIQVLRSDGVSVDAPRTLTSATHEASGDAKSTTLVVYDPTSILTTLQLKTLRSDAANLVLILPSSRELDVFAPGVDQAGDVSYTAKTDCSYRPVQQAGSVSGLEHGYRIATSSYAAIGCLGHDGVYSLVRVETPNQLVTILGSTTVLTNQSIPLAGNAALALGTFGATKHLVWYRPSLADAPAVTVDGIIPNPPWVILAIILSALVLVAAGVWRGRRLGPVVVERMPVTVRASETLEGRARLYQKAAARTHALDALRIGTITRVAELCGLPRLATIDEVIGAVATTTGRSPVSVRALLLDEVPGSDLQLVRLSDELRSLEADVTKAVVPV